MQDRHGFNPAAKGRARHSVRAADLIPFNRKERKERKRFGGARLLTSRSLNPQPSTLNRFEL